ncbi:hypothetical protein [Catalinimonas niigatensis]|uniref:hypothetical protein n=1 Tax=Catalinimonas niigatensis TaxID=1397264 RepID=UPI002666D291|nr:hypothetical protein [Catalinimonas niigatensis]WPP48527.1 hypothetical protein PZB72_17805 [Catalinimonas niigatensis]
MPDKRSIVLLLLATLLLACIFIMVYKLERIQTYPLLFTYSLAFAAYVGIYKSVNQKHQIWWLLGISVLLRLLLLPAVPNLSDDIYRFIWDGRLLIQNIHPFAYLPSEIMAEGIYLPLKGIDQTLFQQLNSPDYFTIYPPVNQTIFALAAWLFPESIMGSVIFIRMFVVLAEVGTLYLLYQLIRQHDLPRTRVLLYGLNPMIIMELSGNLHFEALMICFLLLSYFFLEKNRWLLSSFFFALAICTKLLPLILLPLYLWRLGIRNAIRFYAATGVITLLLFAPLLNLELIKGISESIGLYFQKFEFNASIYYIVREIGYVVKGYNIIQTAGIWLAMSTFMGIVFFSVVERHAKLPVAWLWIWVIYLALSTIVHPWYIAPLIAFGIFTHYRFMMVWAWLIFFSYAGYTADGFEEILEITFAEYAIVLLVLVYELWMKYKGKNAIFSSKGYSA